MAEKRLATFGSSQLVKRQKSDANMNAVAVVNGSAQNGALIQAVRYYNSQSNAALAPS
jgi:Prp8 binding protein